MCCCTQVELVSIQTTQSLHARHIVKPAGAAAMHRQFARCWGCKWMKLVTGNTQCSILYRMHNAICARTPRKFGLRCETPAHSTVHINMCLVLLPEVHVCMCAHCTAQSLWCIIIEWWYESYCVPFVIRRRSMYDIMYGNNFAKHVSTDSHFASLLTSQGVDAYLDRSIFQSEKMTTALSIPTSWDLPWRD